MKTFLSFLIENSGIAQAVVAANIAAGSDSGYKIQPGDTLSRIAHQNNTTVEDILDLNPGIKDPNKITAGQNLILSVRSQDSTDESEESTKSQPTFTQPQPEDKPKPPQPSAWNPLISEFEGFRTQAYWDKTGKVWTLGKGSTTHPDGRPIKRGDTISKQQADEYMQNYVNSKIIPVLSKRIPNWNQMNPNQQSALISFGYNLGPNFYGSPNFETITKALSNQQNWSQVPDAMKLYNKSDGAVLPGLVRRRAAEANLWLMK